MLTARRADLIADRVRMINRLRDTLTSVFPGLEREFDFSSCKGALVLLTGYASPARLRRAGQARLAAWLRQRRVRGYAGVAARAVAAAQAQQITLPGQDIAAGIVAKLADAILALDQRVTELDKQIAAMFAEHPQAEIIQSMPGFGSILGATLLVTAGTWPRSRPPATSPPRPAWSRSRTTPAAGPGTCTSLAGIAARCGACSTSQRRPA